VVVIASKSGAKSPILGIVAVLVSIVYWFSKSNLGLGYVLVCASSHKRRA
jgi:hypothetical protein